jgi:hypothetical protein
VQRERAVHFINWTAVAGADRRNTFGNPEIAVSSGRSFVTQAFIESTVVALKLGIKQAVHVAASNNSGTNANVTGSIVETPYKKLVSSRVHARAPATPIANPTASSVSPSRNIDRTTLVVSENTVLREVGRSDPKCSPAERFWLVDNDVEHRPISP